ncbi:MAG: hypothetical protein ABIH63_02630 [archaeon]
MAVVKKLGVWSVAKIQGIIMAVAGLLLGIFFTFLNTVTTVTEPTEAGLPLWTGPLSIIILPIMYGVIGLIGGAVGAWVYNVAAKFVGGIEIELK